MTRSALALFVSTVLLLATLAHAAQLDKDTCTNLKGEQTKLEQSGLRTSMVKGPEWAKANLPADKLEQIRRLVELDEQILFRCGGRPLVVLPPEADADPAAATDEAKDETKGPAVVKPARIVPADQVEKKAAADRKAAEKKAAAAKAAEKAAVDGSSKESPAKTAPKAEAAVKKQEDPAKKPPAVKKVDPATGDWVVGKAAPKPKPKPKVNDAYQPPPVDPSANPFSGQLDPAAKK